MSDLIHPTAIIADGAEIAADVKIGPYCVIGGDVSMVPGRRCTVMLLLTA